MRTLRRLDGFRLPKDNTYIETSVKIKVLNSDSPSRFGCLSIVSPLDAANQMF